MTTTETDRAMRARFSGADCQTWTPVRVLALRPSPDWSDEARADVLAACREMQRRVEVARRAFLARTAASADAHDPVIRRAEAV
jgi:hypothetical protein